MINIFLVGIIGHIFIKLMKLRAFKEYIFGKLVRMYVFIFFTKYHAPVKLYFIQHKFAPVFCAWTY